MLPLCAGFALVCGVTKDGRQWALPCLPRSALPRAHECLRPMRGSRVEEMRAEEEKECADDMRGELVHYDGR